jgi:1-acyl-sn-glycerol-3-phosphate acyltransferase
VTGIENIPHQGACLLTGNHLGIIDGPLIFCLIHREDATGLVALKHKKNPFIRFIVDWAGGIWINRSRTDFSALKKAYHHLNQGGLLGIAPEGTRSDTHGLIEAHPGVAFLADKADAVILPVVTTGSENALGKMFTLQRPRIHVCFGLPFTLASLDRENRDASLQRNTDEIMCQIAALLPESYREVYADHPRLRELLEQDRYGSYHE